MCADAIDSLWPERADARSIPRLASRLAPNLVAHCCNDAGGKALPPQSPGRDCCGSRHTKPTQPFAPLRGLYISDRRASACLAPPGVSVPMALTSRCCAISCALPASRCRFLSSHSLIQLHHLHLLRCNAFFAARTAALSVFGEGRDETPSARK